MDSRDKTTKTHLKLWICCFFWTRFGQRDLTGTHMLERIMKNQESRHVNLILFAWC